MPWDRIETVSTVSIGQDTVEMEPDFSYVVEVQKPHIFVDVSGYRINDKKVAFFYGEELTEEFEIPYLDLFKVFSSVSPLDRAESLTRNKQNCGAYDGIHPTPHGHILIGAMLYEKIKTLNYPQKTVLCIGDSLTHGYPLAGMGTVEGDNYPSTLNRLFNEL